jgi:hypothetical protein
VVFNECLIKVYLYSRYSFVEYIYIYLYVTSKENDTLGIIF